MPPVLLKLCNIQHIHILTINVPLILQVQDIIFLCGKTYIQPFQGVFYGDQKSPDLHEKPREMAEYMFFTNKKE